MSNEFFEKPILNSPYGYPARHWWRSIADPSKSRVTPETARQLQHWRHHTFSGVRPFFCQIEAVETAIWLTREFDKMISHATMETV